MKMMLAALRGIAFAVLMAMAGSAAAQQPYPNKPIRFIVPYPPGGTTNVLARLVGEKLTESWGQPVIVDNRGGASTLIGSEALTRSAPDGYTILLAGSSHVLIPQLIPMPFDPIKDFAPVATISSTEVILVLHPSLPASTLREFVALAKAGSGKLNYASAGNGSSIHLAAELFDIMTGVRMQHIPYKGSGPAVADLIGGQVQLAFQNPINVVPHIKSGKLKAIAISGTRRLAALPQLPTFAESGLPDFNATNWFGILAPAGTAKEIIDRLSSEVGRILVLPDISDKLTSQGQEPFISTPAELAALLKADMVRYAKIIKTANIKLDLFC
jgi:tripartite-type tricarboxylate transporter receptor subunit TctC